MLAKPEKPSLTKARVNAPLKKKTVSMKARTGANPFTGELVMRKQTTARRVAQRFSFSDLMGADEQHRMALVHSGLASFIVDEAAAALAVPKAALFDAIGLPVSTMTRRAKSGSPLSLDEADRVDRVAQVFKRSIDVFGNAETAREWMSTRVPSLGDRTPLELLDSSAGYQMVLNTIGRIAYGALA